MNNARNVMADYPLGKHSILANTLYYSILLNHIIDKAILEIELREFSTSTGGLTQRDIIEKFIR